MLRFKKNFGKIIKKASNLEEIQSSFMQQNQLADGDQDKSVLSPINSETLNEFKERMNKLESMFAKILDRVDKIGHDVKQIKEN